MGKYSVKICEKHTNIAEYIKNNSYPSLVQEKEFISNGVEIKYFRDINNARRCLFVFSLNGETVVQAIEAQSGMLTDYESNVFPDRIKKIIEAYISK